MWELGNPEERKKREEKEERAEREALCDRADEWGIKIHGAVSWGMKKMHRGGYGRSLFQVEFHLSPQKFLTFLAPQQREAEKPAQTLSALTAQEILCYGQLINQVEARRKGQVVSVLDLYPRS